MVLTGGCPGLPLPAQGWTLDSAGLWTHANPPPFRQLLHLLPGTECRSERHYLFSSCQFFQPLAYQRDSLQITDPRYTPDNKLGPLPGSHGHGFIAGHPASLTPPFHR